MSDRYATAVADALTTVYYELDRLREAAKALKIELAEAKHCSECGAKKKCPYEGITHV